MLDLIIKNGQCYINSELKDVDVGIKEGKNAGLWTVGVGHLIGDGKKLPKEWNKTFTMEEVDNILKDDLARFERGVNTLIPITRLSQNQFDALVSFSFNVGLNDFFNFTDNSFPTNEVLVSSIALVNFEILNSFENSCNSLVE